MSSASETHPVQWEEVLRLLDHDRVDATNNLGEREGRPAVIARELSGGGAGPRQVPAQGPVLGFNHIAKACEFHTSLESLQLFEEQQTWPTNASGS